MESELRKLLSEKQALHTELAHHKKYCQTIKNQLKYVGEQIATTCPHNNVTEIIEYDGHSNYRYYICGYCHQRGNFRSSTSTIVSSRYLD